MTLVQKEIKAVYLWDTKVRPNTNTYLLHMPLETDLSDTSSYWRTATTSGNLAYFSEVWWVNALQSKNHTTRVTIPMTDFTSWEYTQSAWYYVDMYTTDWKCFFANKVGSSYVDVTFVTNSNNWNKWSNYYGYDTFSSLTYLENAWHLITITRDWDTQIMYHDWIAFSTATKMNQNYTYWSIDLLRRSDSWQQRPWYMSDFIVDSKAWSAADVLTYFNNNKSKYWIS